MMSHYNLGTHDVVNATVLETETHNRVSVSATYSEHSTASGALFSFVFITESGDVNFSRSFLLVLDRNASYNHTLPFNLHSGFYKMHVYDIEYDRTLSNGVGYPAKQLSINISGNGCNDQGMAGS
jgi:hypothetical protein